MRHRIKFGLLLVSLLAFDLGAQSSGYYEQLQYRANDPFLFCTQGQDLRINPEPCWKPLPPYTGNYMMMPYCNPPNPEGKPWTADDTRSLQQYLSACPHAEQSGSWQGEGQPDKTPFVH